MFCRHAPVLIVIVFTLLRCSATGAQTKPAQAKPNDLRTYDTRYYVIHTDLGRDAAREAEVRLTRMAEEYHRRTRGFSGEITKKLPFYLFEKEADYHAAGGEPNTAGAYDPNTQTLMAFTGGQANLATWYTVQHEGFHQFADQVIGRGMPIAINEGLAEYFGEAIFTGDAFVAGVIPQWRLKRVRESLKEKKFTPLRELLALSHKEWNAQLSTTNYDQVWTIVQFIVHGDDGARQEALGAFLRGSGNATDVQAAWTKQLGDVDDFETKWRAYWTGLPDEPTAELYAEATLRTLTSFLARATARRQRFGSFDAFLTAAEKGELKSSEADWLPASLLKDALKRAQAMRKDGGTFALVADAPRPPRIVYIDSSAKNMVGRFVLKGSRVDETTIDRPAKAASP
jgi:hypothetical protein